MTDDIKKGARIMLFYMVAAIIVFPVYHLVKGDFRWEDTLLQTGLILGCEYYDPEEGVCGAFECSGLECPDLPCEQS